MHVTACRLGSCKVQSHHPEEKETDRGGPNIFGDGIFYTDKQCICEFPIADPWALLLEIQT